VLKNFEGQMLAGKDIAVLTWLEIANNGIDGSFAS
jgi:hypothetical protein